MVKTMSTHLKISPRIFKLQSGYKYMTEFTIYNVQKAVTPTVGKQEYDSCVLHIVPWCFTHVKVYENISTVFTLQSGTSI